jgi:F420-0:gamma-glutamyl ligase
MGFKQKINNIKMAKKEKTNRQVLASAIKNLNDMEIVILRERILAITEQVINSEKEIRSKMENSIIHPDLYINSCKSIFEQIKFDNN